MSAADILRSFAESREPDDVTISHGITYRTASVVVRKLADIKAERDAADALLQRVETAMDKNLPQQLRDDIWNHLDRYRKSGRALLDAKGGE
jgi:hypothetical protein